MATYKLNKIQGVQKCINMQAIPNTQWVDEQESRQFLVQCSCQNNRTKENLTWILIELLSILILGKKVKIKILEKLTMIDENLEDY